MRAVVVYESMFGNTHHVAEAIATGLSPTFDVTVVPVGGATPEVLEGADLLVVGGPTHAHGMSRERTRASAVETAADPDQHVTLDPDAPGEGLREWFETCGDLPPRAVAFDTRMDLPPLLSGRASHGIRRLLKHHGATIVADPMSFLVDFENVLEDGELERATAWARGLTLRVAELAR
jgi:hypothetical protein